MYAHSHRLKQISVKTGSHFFSIRSVHTFIRTLPISRYSNQIVQLKMKLFTFVEIIRNYTVYASHL